MTTTYQKETCCKGEKKHGCNGSHMHRFLPKTPNGASCSPCYWTGGKTGGETGGETGGWPPQMTQIPRIWVATRVFHLNEPTLTLYSLERCKKKGVSRFHHGRSNKEMTAAATQEQIRAMRSFGKRRCLLALGGEPLTAMVIVPMTTLAPGM